MKRLLLGFAVGFVLNSFVFAKDATAQNSAAWPFMGGGTIHLRLSSGEYSVRPGTSSQIRVRWEEDGEGHHPQDLKKVKIALDKSGNVATLRTDGPTKHVRFTIEIPAQSDLFLNMRAGDVRITGIEGNKEVHMTAGDLTIEVSPASYSLVHATVKIGDLHGKAFGKSSDGFGNSLNWTGAGKYTLNATMFAGDLSLQPAQH
jgi:hypothetical protein